LKSNAFNLTTILGSFTAGVFLVYIGFILSSGFKKLFKAGECFVAGLGVNFSKICFKA